MPSASTVAVVVPSPATSLVLLAASLTSWAPRFSIRVVQLDVLGDGDAVLGHLGRAPALVEHRVAAAGAQRAAHGPGQLLDAGRQRRPGLVVKHHLFCCHANILQLRVRYEKGSIDPVRFVI